MEKEGINLLIIEDNKSIIDGLQHILKKEGFTITVAYSKKEAMNYINNNKFDIFLIDIQLPDGSGFDICKYIKQKFDLPVILASAIGEEANVVYGFDLGADDFIVKPYRNSELVARINCVLKRYCKRYMGDTIIFRNLTIDLLNAKVYNNKMKEINLTYLEFKLFILFLKNRNKLITREQILNSIWDSNGNFVNDNSLSVYIKRLREKIDDNLENKVIETIRGIGYRLND